MKSFWLYWVRDCWGRWHFVKGVPVFGTFTADLDPSMVARYNTPSTQLLIRAFWDGITRSYKPPSAVLINRAC